MPRTRLVPALLCFTAFLLGQAGLTLAVNPFVTLQYAADPSAHVFDGRIYVYASTRTGATRPSASPSATAPKAPTASTPPPAPADAV